MTSLALKDATLSTAEPDGDHLVQAAEHVNTCVGETVVQAMLRPAPELSRVEHSTHLSWDGRV